MSSIQALPFFTVYYAFHIPNQIIIHSIPAHITNSSNGELAATASSISYAMITCAEENV